MIYTYMSNLLSETNIFTLPSGKDVGLKPDMIDINTGSFKKIYLNGVDLDGLVTDISDHIASTVVHGATGAVVGTTNVQTLTNKSLNTNSVRFVDAIDPSKRIIFDVSGATTNTSTTFLCSQSANSSIVIPNGSDTMVVTNNPVTLGNKTIDSGQNTIYITSAPLVSTNINSVINQDVRTTSSPVFTSSIALTPSGDTAYQISGKADFSCSGNAGAFIIDSIVGDVNIRNLDATKHLNLGFGNVSSRIKIGINETEFNSRVIMNDILELGAVSLDNSSVQLLTRNAAGEVSYRLTSIFSSAITTRNEVVNVPNWSNTITAIFKVSDETVTAFFVNTGGVILTQTGAPFSPLQTAPSFSGGLISFPQSFVVRAVLNGVLQTLALVVFGDNASTSIEITLISDVHTPFANGTTFEAPVGGITVTWIR